MNAPKPHVLWFVKDHRFKLPRAVCLCGWSKGHNRQKVQQRAVEKHQENYGATWLNQEPEYAAQLLKEATSE